MIGTRVEHCLRQRFGFHALGWRGVGPGEGVVNHSDGVYRPAPFASDRDRVEHLFGRYEALVNPLESKGIAKNRRVARALKDFR